MPSKINLPKGKNPLVKKILFLETNSDFYSFFRNMYLTLERLSDKMLYFNRRENYFKYGKEKMNKMLLDLIEKEKPDYIFTWLTWDEFFIETLLKINEISPKTKTVVIFGDDTIQFEDFSRYYALLFNFVFTTLKSYKERYKSEGIGDVYFTSLTDATNFKPLTLEKKYDVTFIGSQKSDTSGRYEMIKYLKDNGISLKVFGFGWENYPEFNNFYGGPLKDEEMVRVLNQTKINLCFSKDNFGRPQMKAKIFETGACKTFTLCEYAPDYESYFKEGKEIIYFKTKEELLGKVKYYLKNQKEREKIQNSAHSKVLKEYALQTELERFINQTKNKNKKISLPKINHKTINLGEKEITLGIKKLKVIMKDYDYVSFKTKGSEDLSYKEFFQAYSLEKSKKQISCCNYYVNSKGLGDYLLFFTRDGEGLLSKNEFNSLLDLSQITLTKNFFLDNYEKIASVFKGSPIDFVNKKNTAFVAIPLVRIKDLKTNNSDTIEKAFGLKFVYNLYSLLYQKKFFKSYLYKLALEGLTTKRFILRSLLKNLELKSLANKIKKIK